MSKMLSRDEMRGAIKAITDYLMARAGAPFRAGDLMIIELELERLWKVEEFERTQKIKAYTRIAKLERVLGMVEWVASYDSPWDECPWCGATVINGKERPIMKTAHDRMCLDKAIYETP